MKQTSAFRSFAAALVAGTAVIAFWSTAAFSSAAASVDELRCEFLKNPLGIDVTEPRLSWMLDSKERGARQTAYEILVASSAGKLKPGQADLWDTGKVASDQSIHVSYAGRPLGSRQQCFWKVRVWGKDGKPAWSEVASWTMGLLESSDWQADYISFRDTTPVHKDPKTLFLPPARQYRKEFSAAKKVRRATVYATALGIYELYVNGQRVGDAKFAPGWTDYHQRAYYWTYDVTPLVKKGRNAMGAWLADGWYSGYIGFGLLTGIGTEKIGRYTYGKTPAVMAQLEIEYADGTRGTLVTDKSWKTTGDGPIEEADFLMGEFFDARKEQPGWAKPGFDDRKWEPAISAKEEANVPATFYEFQNADQPDGKVEIEGHPVNLSLKRPPKLEAFPGLPVRALEEIKPIAITSPTNGVYIFNLGQNFAGVVRLKVKGPAGTVVQLRHGEMLHPDGTLMTENLRKARAIDHYVLRGDPKGEMWSPRFTFHGFQYVEVTGYPGKPDERPLPASSCIATRPLTSSFQCSDPGPKLLYKNVVWTQGQLPRSADGLSATRRAFRMDGRRADLRADRDLQCGRRGVLHKWLRELMESQRPAARSWATRRTRSARLDFGTAWCDAGVICPWTIWQA